MCFSTYLDDGEECRAAAQCKSFRCENFHCGSTIPLSGLQGGVSHVVYIYGFLVFLSILTLCSFFGIKTTAETPCCVLSFFTWYPVTGLFHAKSFGECDVKSRKNTLNHWNKIFLIFTRHCFLNIFNVLVKINKFIFVC